MKHQVEKNKRSAAAMANATKGRGGTHASKKKYDRKKGKSISE